MSRFGRRWLAASGLPRAEAAAALRATRRRIARYPALLRPAFQLAPEFVEWLGPILALSRWTCASRLGDDDFDEMLERLESHRWGFVRGLALAARVPVIEQTLPDPTPDRVPVHPLAGRTRRRPARPRLYDVAVIGTGAGGGPLAWALSRRGYEVAAIEAGRLARPGSVRESLERDYLHHASTVALGNCFLPVIAGRAVGGTTVVNSGTSLRPTRETLEGWDRLAGTRFGEGELDRWFDLVDERIGVTTPPRDLLGRSAEMLERGLAALGRPPAFVLPRNAPECRGDGRCCFVCPTGAKQSVDRSWLPQAAEAGCEILAPARAMRIRESDDRVEVELLGPEGPFRVEARRLVVAAGALSTPGLVRANRLGSAWRGAGDSFKCHPAAKVTAHFPEAVEGAHGVPQGLGYKIPELPTVQFEGIFTPPAALAPMIPATGRRLRWWFDRYAHVATFGFMIRDRGTGWVRSLGDFPLIRYDLHPDDARDVREAILFLAEVFFAAGADRVLLPISSRANELVSPEDVRRIPEADFTPDRVHMAAFHPQGTCGIGRVVDTDLALLGSRRIHVCDASVFPDSPGVNPQLTIMALSLRLADHLLRQAEGTGLIRRARGGRPDPVRT